MKPRSYLVIPSGLAGGSNSATRTLMLGDHKWELRTPEATSGDAWTWKRASLLKRAWSLESEQGTHMVFHALDVLSRRWRAESATGGWTLSRAWNRRVTVTDEHDAVVLQAHPGWFRRSIVEPASGSSLSWRRHWPSGLSLETSEGRALFTIRRAPGFFSRDRRLTLTDSAREREDLLPLLALTWLLTLAARHSHAH